MSKLLKGILTILLIFILSIGIVGCGLQKSASNESKRGTADQAAPQEVVGSEPENQYGDQELLTDKAKTESINADQGQSDRKMIHTKYYLMETLEFDKVVTSVEQLVEKNNGYIETSEASGIEMNSDYGYNTRNAYYTIRIPAQHLEKFYSELEALGNVVSERATKEDATTQLVDAKARIKSLEIQETRLLELVKTGGALKDILEIETQLSEVRYQIESYKATLTNLENRVSYGTVQLELREVLKETDLEKPAITIGERITSGFMNSITHVKDFFIDLFVLLIVALPYLVVWALFIGLIFIGVKKFITKKRKKDKKVEPVQTLVSEVTSEDKSDAESATKSVEKPEEDL